MTQIVKVGHFYLATLGHYHVAATLSYQVLTFLQIFAKLKNHGKDREKMKRKKVL